MILLKDLSLECGVGCASDQGRTIIFFDGGGEGRVEKLSHANIIILYAGPAAKNFFRVFPPSCKHFFFSCVQFTSVFTASANNLFQNFPSPPPGQKNNGRPLIILVLFSTYRYI